MDFQTLARKELQALCKKNKIPANLTNLAMANALQSLEHVEGLEELCNSAESCDQQSPEKTANGSIDVPRTAGRTTTQRAAKEPPSAQQVTQTRRTTRRMAQQESGQGNVSDTPAVPTTRRRAAASSVRKMDTHLMDAEDNVECEKGDIAKTPAISTRARKAPAGSARTKTESKKVDASVQKVYSTRRSAKLLEDSMSQLMLGAKGETEPVKKELEDEAKADADLTLKKSDKENTISVSDEIETVNEEGSDDSANSDGKTEAIIDVGKDIESSNDPEKTKECAQVENETQITASELATDSEILKKDLKDDVKEDTHSSPVSNNKNEEASDDSAHFNGISKTTVDDQTIAEDINAEKTNETLQIKNQAQVVAPNHNMDSKDSAEAELVPEIVESEVIENAENKEETVQLIAMDTAAEGTDLPEVEEVVKVHQIEDQSINMEDLVDVEVTEAADSVENSILVKSLNSVTSAENPELKTQDLAGFENLVDVNVISEVDYSIPNLPPSDQNQMTVQKLPPLVSDNKENIQTISNTNDENKGKKDLEELSIRQLTKLLKEKLQITTNEQENAGKPRKALQAVSDNLMTK